MRKEKNIGFKKQFFISLDYLRESRNYIWAIALIFVVGIFFGAAYSSNLGFLDDILKGLIDKIEGLDEFGIILFILQNNLKSAFFGMALGLFLGIFPILNCFSNGAVLGYVMKGVWDSHGVAEFWRILPHGVFELPAVFISLSLGLKLGMFIFAKEKGKEFMRRARNSMILFVCVVIPLLIIAAVIEGLLISFYK